MAKRRCGGSKPELPLSPQTSSLLVEIVGVLRLRMP
jgi:hypothetical protein